MFNKLEYILGTLYSELLRRYLLPFGDFLSSNRVMHYYGLLNELQWCTRTQLTDFQNSRLIETVNTAYTEVPFYRELYDRYGLSVKKIKGTSDLPMLPIVTKEELRESYPDRCTRYTKWPWREYCTSGSSGRPFAVRVDNETMSMTRALMFLRASYSGWKIGRPIPADWDDLEPGHNQEDQGFNPAGRVFVCV